MANTAYCVALIAALVVTCGSPRRIGGVKTITNGDRIRAMTDEELAEFISRVEIGDCDYGKTFCDLCDINSCGECLLEWLKQPYKEDET